MKILFLGDVCPTKDYQNLFNDLSGNALFNDVRKLINQTDYTVCNFECPATDEEKAIVKCGPSLKASPEHLTTLKNVGVSAVSLANNHVLDYGVKGLQDTVISCKENGISYFGIQVNGNLERDRLILKKDGETVTVLSFAEQEFNYIKEQKTGAVQFDPYESLDKIREAKKIGKVVVLYHGGIEYYRYPSPLLRKKCLKMVQAGADAVLCQHSHVIGTKEEVDGAFILYGQGNSVFGYRENSSTWNEGLAVVFDTQKGVSLELITAKPNGIYMADESRKTEVISDIENLSKNFTDEFLNKEWKKFCEEKQALYYPMLFGKGRIYNKLNRIMKNKLFNTLISKKKKMTTMNLIRCDAHNEVVETILEKDYD